MSCVNKSSREFRTLAANNNISANTLELITHKYWLETGSEELLPTNVYIQAQLGNTQYKETIPEVRKLWQQRYNKPITYPSYTELQKGYNEALKYFPQNAVVYYKDNRGNFVLSIKQPVEAVYNTASEYFGSENTSAKTIDLGLDENREYGINKVEELFNQFNTDRTSRHLAEKVFNLAKDLGIKVKFDDSLPSYAVGRTTNKNTIIFRKSALERDINADKKASLLLHEAIHAVTMYALSDKTENRSKALEKFRTDINQIFNEVRYNDALKGERGIHDVIEFVAELGNPVFREKLQSIDKDQKKSIWTRIVDAIKNLLGIHTSSTYYNRSMNALNKALNAFDMDSYLEYNGLKNPLQQAYYEHKVDFENMSEEELKSMLKDAIKEDGNTLSNKTKDNEQDSISTGIQKGGKLLGEALKLFKREGQGNDKENAGKTNEGKSLRERLHEEAARQQQELITWARNNNELIVEPNDYFDEFFEDSNLKGSESKIWVNPDKNTVVKSISVAHYPNVQALLERVAIHNSLFPTTAMTLQGVGTSDNGISIIVEQPYIEDSGVTPTFEEIERFMADEGFTHTKGKGVNAEYVKDGMLVSDIRPENVIKQPDGSLAVIDCFAKFQDTQAENSSTLESLIDNMSKDQLVSELRQIRQEFADYDLVTEEENEPKKSHKFTFNDGTSVNTPFTPNSQQEEALNVMNDFIHSNATSMTLSGYAGTGKTSLMEIIAQKARRDGKNIVFCATTNKAAAVLKSKVSRQGFDASTLNKVFGINVEVDTTKAYDAKNLVNRLREAQIPWGSTVIIDEASMINEENYRILNQVANENGLKIIYVGDRAQLAPVGENKVSKVFRNTDGKVIELTKVERTDDNAILKEATNIRNGKPLSQVSSFNDEGKGVAYINPKGEHRQAIIDVIKHYIEGLRKDPNFFRILAYTNKAVTQYNNYVRRELGYTDPTPRVGEPIMGYANWGYDWHTKTYQFINSESYKVTRVSKPETRSLQVGNQNVTMTVIPITLEDSLGNRHTFDFMDIKGNQANRDVAVLLATMKKNLWERARTASKSAKRDIYAQINAIDKFLFVNDNILDSQGHYLQSKTFDFGYALTIHKSQGSTFTHVLMDENDVSKASNSLNDAANALSSVDLGDESFNDASTATLNSSEDVDLGVDFDSSTAQAEQPSDIANMKQQLEYVGVSRATDTVIVISDKAQKEDSPLNHLKGTIKRGNTSLDNRTETNNDETKDDTIENRSSSNVEVYHGNWSRADVEKQADKVFLFGDNTNDRLNTHHVPSMTQAVIRGLPNAIGIDTKKNRGTSADSYFTDADFDTFKAQVDEAIQKAIDSRKTIVIPEGGIGTGKAMLQQKAPRLFNYLQEQLNSLQNGTYSERTELNNTLNDYIDGRKQFNNLSQEENNTARRDKLLAAAGIQARRNGSTGKEESQDERNERQEKQVEQWAKQEGVWHDDATAYGKSFGEELPNGQESHVYENPSSGTVIKVKNTLQYHDLQEFLDGIVLHNTLFPETAYKVLGFGNDGEGFVAILEQPYVRGTEPTQEQITEFLRTRVPDAEMYEEGLGNGRYKTSQTLLHDLSPRNAIITPNGNIAIIDDIIRPNVASEGKGGKRSDDYSIGDVGGSQKVSLPAYEYFNNLYEDTTVDATWKIPLLKDLDSKISNDNTEEENNRIIAKMNDILNASVEEDIKEISPKKEEQIQQNLNEYEKLNQEFDNLLDGKFADEENGTLEELDIKLSASEIRKVAELIGNYISDLITDIQKDGNKASEMFPEMKFKDDVDFTKMSRLDIVRTIGIDNFIQRAKMNFSPDTGIFDMDDVDVLAKAQLITENWEAMMLLASDVFAGNEGFGIKRDYDHSKFDLNENKNQVAYDDFNGYQDEEITEEQDGDSQEHWQVEQRTIDVLNSMSALVRQGLHECYILDKDGNKVIDDDWKMPLRVNPRKATNSILRWVQGSLSIDDMISKLSAKQGDNPWLQQLVERLSDRSGKETDFQSQFYGVFSKPFQLYSIVLLDNGKYTSIPVNSHPALTEAMNTITAQYKIGTHPLISAEGKIKGELLGNENTISKDYDFNLHQALANLQTITNSLKTEEFDADKAKDASKWLAGTYRALGYNVTEEMVSDVLNADNVKDLTLKLGYMVKSLDSAYKAQRNGVDKAYQPFTFGADNNIGGTLRNFLTPITDSLEDTAVSAFYDSGKMYQSYVTPSFMTKLVTKFHLPKEQFDEFMMNEYGDSEWFREQRPYNMYTGITGWKNEMLRLLSRDEDARKVFDFKVELNFNKHNYMRNMSDSEYTLSLITEYNAENNDNELVPAWFRMPMQSNKPSSEFLKFYSYRGQNYKDTIVGHLYNMFLQELSRIQTARMRNLNKSDNEFIKNFDSNGRKFNFLPFLNSYLEDSATAKQGRTLLRNADNTVSADNDRLAKLLQRKIEGIEDSKLSTEEEAELKTLVERAVRNHMEQRASEILDEWENSGIIEAARGIKNIVTHEEFLNEGEKDPQKRNEWVRKALENYIWNDYLASKNILQLTVGDIAFYKDAEDLQKRLAQLHAPGIRGNIHATDYGDGVHEAKPVTDGKYRTIILKDFDNFISNIIANITEVFDRKIANAPESQKAELIALKDSLVRPRKVDNNGKVIDEGGKYWNINVTDAQGYSSPSSYRKKAFIFGKWSRHAEDIYQKLLKGEYNYTDLEAAFQPLKPFVYTHLKKDMGVANAPIHTMHVPFQAKNSEYLLIMADAILQGEKLSRPNLLRAVYRVMQDSERLNPTKGIDTVQFESAIKSGLQGAMDIHQFADMTGGEEAAYTFMMNQIYKANADGTRSSNYNTDTFVHEASYEDYCLQQEVPEHFKDHSQAHGSQIRMITPSDLDYVKDPNADPNDEANKVYYEWTEPDGTKKRLRADEFRKEYEDTIAENIEDSINHLSEEFHLNSQDRRERNIALSKVLQREILSSPRYGVDLLQACSIDKKTGEFRIPKGDPIQAKRIEQLINSIIKNRVNKQKIAGGPIVQVTNFGTSRQLQIRFNDKQGNLLKTKEEFLRDDSLVSQYKTYEKYAKENQGGIAYFEVFAPIWSKELFDNFADENGNIDMEAIENCDPELLKMVSYRIPTEDKYSCAPMKVVGFMPREAGDAIMLPYELTTIDDSDFDVDKRYVMRKQLPIKRKKRSEIAKIMYDKVLDSYLKAHDNKINHVQKTWLRDQVNMFLDNPQKMKNMDSLMKYLNSIYRKNAWTTERPVSGRLYRDNKIVDMTLAVLTNEVTADKILNPGGFDAPKRMGYMVSAYKNAANRGISWRQLQGMSIDELKDLCYTAKDLAWVDTQVQFYRQNSASSNLIGVFAVNKVAHAVLESNGIMIDISEICGNEPFTIAGTTFGGRMAIDSKYDSDGNLIGKTLGSLVSASADGVKDPVLNLMNVNMTTANVLNTMLRLGMSFDKAALFLSQDVISRTLKEFNNRNLTNYEPLTKVISEQIKNFENDNDISDDSNIQTQELTEGELVEGLLPTEHKVTDYKVLLALQRLMDISNAMRKPTFATRFNSISSAVGPLIIDNLIMEHKMEQFMDSNSDDGTTHFYDSEGINVDIDDIFYDHPVLKQFARSVDIAKELFKDMPAGSQGFREVLKTLPDGLSEKIFGDKKLLSQLSDFYQSYLLIASGLVNPKELNEYINDFPKWYNTQNFKEKYPENALIQAIKVNVSRKTNRPFLEIKTTGMDTQQKEELSSAWIDLHKENPSLSTRLFIYNFFRAGIGFSPKTFMSLVPMYVKEHLSTTDADSRTTSYVDTFREFPTVTPNIVIDQFIRNNWNNNKLAPWKGGKGTKYSFDYKKGIIEVRNPDDIADLNDVLYMKTRGNGQTYLWRRLSTDKDELVYKMIKPLGDNGEYIEMSLDNIKDSLSTTTKTEEDNAPQSLQEQSSAEEETSETSTEGKKAQEGYKASDLAELVRKQNPKLNETQALSLIKDAQKKPKQYVGFFQNVFKQKGLNLNRDETLEEFNKYC